MYAIKVIVRDKLDQRDWQEQLQIINEIRIQRALRYCGNIIKLLKIYESDKYLNLLLEFQEGGTLGDMLEKQVKVSEEDTRMIVAQLLLTLDFMSRKNIIHRDLKPENILLHSRKQGVYDIRIADFGFAVFSDKMFKADDPDDEIICGTPGYIAPEALEGKGYTFKSDIFSVGSILYNLLTMKNLFNGRNYQAVMNKNLECNLSHIDQNLKRCSQEAKDIIKQLLNKEPEKRPIPIKALTHPWFTDDKSVLKNSINLNQLIAENSHPQMRQ